MDKAACPPGNSGDFSARLYTPCTSFTIFALLSIGITTNICPFFFFIVFTLAAESVTFVADAAVVKLSFAVLSELSAPLQAIIPKIMDMITLPCMSLLVVFCFILAICLLICITRVKNRALPLIRGWGLHFHSSEDDLMEEVLTSVPTRHPVCPKLFFVE